MAEFTREEIAEITDQLTTLETRLKLLLLPK
jgi:protein subunit release factor A